MKNFIKESFVFKYVAIFTIISFLSISIFPSQALAQGVFGLPQPGTMVSLSPSFYPVLLRGVQVHPENPLRFDFIMDTGDTGLEGEAFKQEASKVIKYFLASLTVPEDEFWVNLSPYEKDRIMADMLGQTEMGRDLLSQDYMLKQLTATLINPDSEIGKNFWNRVYKKSYEMYGTTKVPTNTFNKVWIVPNKAVVYEQGAHAFVGDRHLKVMLEEDYLALENNAQRQDLGLDNIGNIDAQKLSKVSSLIVKEILIPEIEKEVNQGKTFAKLRQIFDAMILATWYKKTLKQSLLGQIYVDQNKVSGIDIEDKTAREQIYDQYLESFKKGVFDLVKVEKDIASNKHIPRKYFSGGVVTGVVTVDDLDIRPMRSLGRKAISSNLQPYNKGKMEKVTVDLASSNINPDRINKEERLAFDRAKQKIHGIVNFGFDAPQFKAKFNEETLTRLEALLLYSPDFQSLLLSANAVQESLTNELKSDKFKGRRNAGLRAIMTGKIKNLGEEILSLKKDQGKTGQKSNLIEGAHSGIIHPEFNDKIGTGWANKMTQKSGAEVASWSLKRVIDFFRYYRNTGVHYLGAINWKPLGFEFKSQGMNANSGEFDLTEQIDLGDLDGSGGDLIGTGWNNLIKRGPTTSDMSLSEEEGIFLPENMPEGNGSQIIAGGHRRMFPNKNALDDSIGTGWRNLIKPDVVGDSSAPFVWKSQGMNAPDGGNLSSSQQPSDFSEIMMGLFYSNFNRFNEAKNGVKAEIKKVNGRQSFVIESDYLSFRIFAYQEQGKIYIEQQEILPGIPDDSSKVGVLGKSKTLIEIAKEDAKDEDILAIFKEFLAQANQANLVNASLKTSDLKKMDGQEEVGKGASSQMGAPTANQMKQQLSTQMVAIRMHQEIDSDQAGREIEEVLKNTKSYADLIDPIAQTIVDVKKN